MFSTIHVPARSIRGAKYYLFVLYHLIFQALEVPVNHYKRLGTHHQAVETPVNHCIRLGIHHNMSSGFCNPSKNIEIGNEIYADSI